MNILLEGNWFTIQWWKIVSTQSSMLNFLLVDLLVVKYIVSVSLREGLGQVRNRKHQQQ